MATFRCAILATVAVLSVCVFVVRFVGRFSNQFLSRHPHAVQVAVATWRGPAGGRLPGRVPPAVAGRRHRQPRCSARAPRRPRTVPDAARPQDVYRRTGKMVPDGRRSMVDRAAYMSFLESQLERVTASCKTVESYNSRIDTMQDAMAGAARPRVVLGMVGNDLTRRLLSNASPWPVHRLLQVPRPASPTTPA